MFLQFLSNGSARSRAAVLTAAIMLLVVFGAVDYITPPELVSSILYLIPLFLVSWYFNKRAGLLSAVLISATGYLIHSPLARPAADQLTHFGNSLTALTVFVLFAYILGTLRETLEQEKALARTDHVTSLANGRAFLESVDREIPRAHRYQRPLTVAYMDIDGFKKINDTRGHAAGDALLRLVAETAKGAIRKVDICARVGGDEFAFLFPESDFDHVHKALERLRRRLDEMVRLERYGVSFSLGAVTCLLPVCGGDALIKAADDMMYAVKKSGKNGLRHIRMNDGAAVPGGEYSSLKK